MKYTHSFLFYCFKFIFICYGISPLSAGKWNLQMERDLDSFYQGIISHVTCVRPTLPEGPVLDHYQDEGRDIFRAIGFGGGGFSDGPDLIQRFVTKNFSPLVPDLKIPIGVIGDGIIGRLMAFKLKDLGYSDITIYSDPQHQKGPSNSGPRVFYPNDPDTKTCEFYACLPDAVRDQMILPITIFSNVPLAVSSVNHPLCGMLDSDATLIIQKRDGTSEIYSDLQVMRTFSISASTLMDFLRAETNHFPRKEERIVSYNQLSQNHIVDCSGMGITNSAMGVRGHLVTFSPASPAELFSIQSEDGRIIQTSSTFFNFRLAPLGDDNRARFPLGAENPPLIRLTQMFPSLTKSGLLFTLSATHRQEDEIRRALKIEETPEGYHELESHLIVLRVFALLGADEIELYPLKTKIRALAEAHNLDIRFWRPALENSYRFSLT